MKIDLNDIRIVFVSMFIPPDHSGAGKRVYNFYNYLIKNEIDAGILTNTIGSNNNDNIIQIKSLRSKSNIRRLSHLANFVTDIFQLIIVVRRLNPKNKTNKVVWLVSTNHLTFAATIIFKLLGYKLITQNTLLGSDDPEFRYPNDVFGIKFKLKKLQYYISDSVTSISPALYNLTKRYHSNVLMIPNPVDISKFRNNFTVKEKRKKKKVLIVGSISYRKGSDIVLKTILKVHEIDSNIEFIFIGPIFKLKEICDEEGIDLLNFKKSNVKFEGFVKDPIYYYKNSSIMFLPSRNEGFGSAFIEAMAADVPVVTKQIDGITDFIFGKNAQTVIDSDDPEKYSNLLLHLLNNSNLYLNEVEKCRTNVKRFDLEIIYKEYIQLILSNMRL